MEIRALTGFDKKTREQYGRSYTPLNGTHTLLGMGNMTFAPTMTESEQAEALKKFGVEPTGEVVATETIFAPIDTNANQAATEPPVKMKNFFEKYKKPLMVAGGVVAAFLIYKQFKK